MVKSESLDSISAELKRKNIHVEVSRMTQKCFFGGLEEIICISVGFFLGSLASGFINAIGDDIWQLLKKLFKVSLSSMESSENKKKSLYISIAFDISHKQQILLSVPFQPKDQMDHKLIISQINKPIDAVPEFIEYLVLSETRGTSEGNNILHCTYNFDLGKWNIKG